MRSGRALEALGRRLAAALLERYPEATLLFGPAYKGIALATAAAAGAWSAHGRDLGVLFDRKESKAHGEEGLFIGQHPRPGDRVVIIDDVLSSGGTKLQAARALQATFGVEAEGILVTLDRTRRGSRFDALPVHALAGLEDLAQFMAERGDERAALVRSFWEGGR